MSLSLAELHEGSVQYCFDRALLMPIADWRAVRADTAVGQRIARHYHAAPVIDQRAVPAYRALRQEIKQQFASLTGPPEKGGLGVRVITQAEEAYGDVDDLVADLCGAREVRVFGSAQSGQDHPFLTTARWTGYGSCTTSSGTPWRRSGSTGMGLRPPGSGTR